MFYSIFMGGEFIPEQVAQFIVEKIDSVAELEALLLLRSSPEQRWTVETLARRLYIDVKQTAALLIDLCTQGFVVDDAAEPSSYRYRPRSEELRELLDRVAEVHAKHLLALTELIHSKPKTRVQQFADAFKFRKDD